MPQETWLPVIGWERLYEVSDLGKVRSLPRQVSVRGGKTRTMGGKILKPRPINKGHLLVFLYPGHVARTVHSIVADAFLGPRPVDYVTRHLDGNPANNCVSNLSYGTQSDNLRDCYLSYDGAVGSGKLHAKDVREIRALLDKGLPQTEIAKIFGVSKSSINHIHKGTTYQYLH